MDVNIAIKSLGTLFMQQTRYLSRDIVTTG
jgi:hypothetical protein